MSKRVLLIEYEPRYVERLQGLLPPPEFSVSVAHDGEEGLKQFSTMTFDLILLSGMLPRLPSAEVIREIRKKGGATAPPILLMVTGYTGNNPKADAQKVGAFDILSRPFTDGTFKETVNAALESTDVGARTMRIQLPVPTPSPLTASEIFSDVLEDLGVESTSRQSPHAVIAPSAHPKHVPSAEEEVERRLRDTLSGILEPRTGRATTAVPTPPQMPAPAAASAAPRFSRDADIDRMISDTLSGIGMTVRGDTGSGVRRTPLPNTLTPPPGIVTPPPQALGTPLPGTVRAPSETLRIPAETIRTPLPGTLRTPAPGSVTPPISASGPDRFGQYQLLEKIGSGGMAELYKARRSGVEGFQKIVAIKKILPHMADNDEFITMFADEAKLAAQLNHPNIVHIYDLGKIDGGGYFIAMEYVDGRDLRAILQASREVGAPLPVPLAVYVASKVAAALDYAHRRRDHDGHELNVVHRDVSPQNILISFEGDIKLCDFGIAKAATKASQTQTGALKGKVQYMSPEQAWGRSLDRRSDLFSLGAVLCEMLTGEKLFRGDSDLNVLEKVRAADVAPPSHRNADVPKNLDAIVMKALSREPDDRYSNASDLLRDLEAVLYSYTPAPGSADLAIYLHRLATEESALAEARQREAARAAPEEPDRKRRSKTTPVARRTTGSTPLAAAPEAPNVAAFNAVAAAAAGARKREKEKKEKKEKTASGVFGAFSSKRIEAEKKSRTPLYAMIAAAALILIGGSVWLATRGRPSAAVPAANAITPAATPLSLEPTPMLEAALLPTTPAAGTTVDPKAVEEEVQRQLAAKRKELQKAIEENRAAAAAADTRAQAPQPTPVPEPSPEPTEAPVVRIEPTAVPTAVPVVAEVVPTRQAPREEGVTPGDLVGPGPDVVEPALLSTPRIVYPPIARQQRVSGKVIVLVLIDEKGSVMEARLQQGIASRTGVNEAVLQAVRSGRFRAATKQGIPVKMWRTVVVDVRP